MATTSLCNFDPISEVTSYELGTVALKIFVIAIRFNNCGGKEWKLANTISDMKHQWSSGRIVPCHGTDPGSFPGWCKSFFCFVECQN